MDSHTVSLIPEVREQPIEARVHSGSARGVGGLGLQGQVEQETRHRGTKHRRSAAKFHC